MTAMAIPLLLRRLHRSDRGASLVEFAILLPMFILLFGAIVEGGRLAWSYQSVADGVRDAARYFGRVAPPGYCVSGGAAPTQADLERIVRESSDGVALFPAGRLVTVSSVTAACVPGTWDGAAMPVVQVTATVTIEFPLGGLLAAFGGAGLSSVTATISDKTRVFGP